MESRGCVLSMSCQVLSAEYGKGFDKTNVWNMIRFFRMFSKRDALRPELSWNHYRHFNAC